MLRKNRNVENVPCPKCSKSKQYSKIAIKWLANISPNILHAENGGEFAIDQFHVDGYDKENNIVYEFLGDIWHGNLKMFNEDYKCHPFKNKTAKELNIQTFNRLNYIKNKGFKVIYIWEEDFKNNINLKGTVL